MLYYFVVKVYMKSDYEWENRFNLQFVIHVINVYGKKLKGSGPRCGLIKYV